MPSPQHYQENTPEAVTFKQLQQLQKQVKQPKCRVRSSGWVVRRLLRVLSQPFRIIFRPKVIDFGAIATVVPSQTYQLGEFTINWQGADTQKPYLYINHADNPSKIVWHTPAGQNFIAGAKVYLEIIEERGSVEIDENRKSQFPNQTVDRIEEAGDFLVIFGRLQESRSQGESAQYALYFRTSASNQLDFYLHIIGDDINLAQLRFATSADEHFYGFGEQFSRIDCKGYEVRIVTEEGGIGRGDPGPKTLNLLGVAGTMFSSYAPAPHFITSKMRSLFLMNTEPSVFDLREKETASVRIFSNRMQGRILAGETPLELIELYSAHTGRMPPLPDWVNYGAIVGMQGGSRLVRSVWEKLRALNTPIAGFWLQDWVGQRKTAVGKQLWWNWQLDENTYPHWKELVADLAQEGIRVGVYINPFLVNPPSEQIQGRRNLYQEAEEQDFLVKDEAGEIYLVDNTDFAAALVDLSNPNAREWFKSLIKEEILGNGAKFWMADFAEAAQFDGKFYSQESGLSYHNQYVVDWAQVNREAIAEAGKEGEAWFFNRAGYLKTPLFSTAMWLGDQNVTWKENDGMPSALKGLISGGISGFSINHSDIGGYTSIAYPILLAFGIGFKRSQELLFRWMEMNAFSPIFRTHEGNQPDANVQFYTNDETLATFSYWAKIYAAFAGYRKKLMAEAATTGYPLVRHLFLHYPDDPNTYKIEDKFLLGSEFLIAPVLKPGATSVNVYLPIGKWVHLWSGNTYGNAAQGMYQQIDAPVGQPPVFYRQGSPDAQVVLEALKEKGLLN
ncbi:alpha-glucosidase [Chlorogloeopsis sp. ULAP01]|uniref:alpha-glucosidase n=1 Tax=Chlorogloeopsis sp. ULAP01 TaxID=3056483 RepID=UPI0025AA34D3|nr:alpha-glucosidase [Chlorogloeopsis sp. ULAP01]MDM9384366.1 alpha-glucosidase [Chlorogloeopsis sp. ULAP01]